MQESHSFTVAELAAHVGGRVVGDDQTVISRVAALESAGDGEVSYVEDAKYYPAARTSGAACLIVPERFARESAADSGASARSKEPAMIEVKRPKLAFSLIGTLLHPAKQREPGIDSSAVIASTAELALTVFVGPHVSIGENAQIGAGTRLEAGVTIGDNVSIGVDCVFHPGVTLYDGITVNDRVILHVGVCLGADGFGYVRAETGYRKFPQIGTVLIEDDVELGAYTCVDRGAMGRTRIGRGTKLDNLVHVGHNCDIGDRVVIAAQTGISGSVVIEDDCVIGGQVGFGDHIRVLSGAVIGSKAGVLPGKIVRPGVWWGIPIQPLEEYKRLNAHLGRLPQMREELKQLRQRLAELEKKYGEAEDLRR
ncbi:MAG: UDP-3-O-(3-hydroxymyristoyl)glucosamine N-acyltransferase [bacterium]